MKQPGVTWHDRVGQKELWQEWAKSNIFFYPTNFPETSCITSMEAQACGAIPVTTNFWALKQNVLDGYKFDGRPQESDVVKSLMIEKVIELLQDSSDWDAESDGVGISLKDLRILSRRQLLQTDAEDTFDWNRIADQWEGWIKEDLA